MILTKKQKSLLQNLMQSEQGLRIKELEQQLGTSRRTLYRLFSQLRPLLADQALSLVNVQGFVQLAGTSQALTKLASELKETRAQRELSVTERENALASLLLWHDEPQTIWTLSHTLAVSQATVKSDLKAVTDSFTNYQLQLIRQPGVGIYVETSESLRRRLLSRILLVESNDYLFFNYLKSPTVQTNNFFLRLLDKETLVLVKSSLQAAMTDQMVVETDHQFMALIFLFSISLIRMQQGHPLVATANAAMSYQAMVYRFFACVSKVQAVTPPRAEVLFLARQLQLRDRPAAPAYDDNQTLAASVRINQFVQTVSTQFKWDFERNPTFLARLKKHILGLLQDHVARLPNVKIDTLTWLIDRFPALYQVIRRAWQTVFPDEGINDSEMQLLLLYFANEYRNASEQHQFSALVICDNGIGTAAILASRLRAEFPVIKQLKLAKASQLSQLPLQQYDLILSTLKLPGFPREYKLVSPLLLEDEFEGIKQYLAAYVQKYPAKAKAVPALGRQIKHPARQLANVAMTSLLYSELVETVAVVKLDNQGWSLPELLRAVSVRVGSEFVRNPDHLADKLLARLRLAPLGIPHSETALIHTSSHAVRRCYFGLYDLAQPLKMRAMDQLDIRVTRLLVMLAPANLSDTERAAMGMLSSMIVMDDANLKCFTHGSPQAVKDLISQQFLALTYQQLQR
ncbi:MAG: BglG family transcription antiterminator [Lactobacillus sp.]